MRASAAPAENDLMQLLHKPLVRVLTLVGAFVVLFAGLLQFAFWRLAMGRVDEGNPDLVLVGRIARVGMTDEGDRVDARENSLDRYHFVRFEVETVVRGNWVLPDIGVAVHSPSMSFGADAKSVGERLVLTFEQRTLESGKTVLVYRSSAACLWILPPCGRS
jgi:hypothetical protein